MAAIRPVRALNESQTATLLAIWDWLASGRFPTAKQLADQLKIEKQAATQRVYRLKRAGYLREKGGNLVIDGTVVVDQPETAALLVHLHRRMGKASGSKLTSGAIGKIARSDFGIQRKQVEPLLELLVRAQYLAEVDGWADHLKLGPRVSAELDYLRGLASRLRR